MWHGGSSLSSNMTVFSAHPAAAPTDLLCVAKPSRSALRITRSQGTLAVMRLWLVKERWRTGCLQHRGERSGKGKSSETARPASAASLGS